MSLFSNFVPFKAALENYIGQCKSVFDEIGDRTSSTLVDGFIRDLEKQRYSITIVGGLKRGKSTLLNAMMGRRDDNISPISSVVCTSAIIKYLDKNITSSGNKDEHAVVYFDEDGQSPAAVPLQRVKDFVTESGNPGNRKKVRTVEVFGDFPEWSKAVAIIDSPGQGSVFSYHDVLLTDFFPYTDAIIFLVAADIPLDGNDLALLKELSANEKKKIFFVLTKVDNIENPDDRSEVVDYVAEKIRDHGLRCDKLYSVSAKPVYEALVNGASEMEVENLKAQNGLLDLENDLERFIVKESDQTKVLSNRIKMLLEKTTKACDGYISSIENVLSRETYDLEKLHSEEMELTEANKLLREKIKKSLRMFEREWKNVLNRFNRSFYSKSGIIEDKIIDSLRRGGFIGAVFQSFKLKQRIQEAVGTEVEPLVNDLESKAEDVISKLNEEFDEEISLYVRKRGNGTDVNSVAASYSAAGLMAGAAMIGTNVTMGAIGAAQTAFTAWQTASYTANAAEAAHISMGIVFRFWAWLVGSGKAAKTASDAAMAATNAANAATSAMCAGVGAVVTAGMSIAVTILVQKILHCGLVKFQEGRVPNVVDAVMDEMEKSLFASLDKFKESITSDYQKYVDDLIAERTERIDEIKRLINSDNAEEKMQTSIRLEKVKGLLSEGLNIKKQIPVLIGATNA